MKAILRHSLLVILFLGLMPVSCDCDDPRPFKLNLDGLSLSLVGAGINKKDTPISVAHQGEFFIQVIATGDEEYVMDASPKVPVFTQSLMANAECPPNYCTAFSVEIDSFGVFSDTIFSGQPAGTALNDFFDIHYIARPGWPALVDSIAFSAFNDSLRMNPQFLVSDWHSERFSLKAIDFIQPGNYRFTVTMLLKDGTLISKESDRVHFE